MDAVKFIKERNRMCKSFYAPEYGSCRDCPAKWEECSDIDSEDINPNKIVAIVEEWSAAHPRKTRQSVFLELFPNAPVYTSTSTHICALNPCNVDTTLRGHCPT